MKRYFDEDRSIKRYGRWKANVTLCLVFVRFEIFAIKDIKEGEVHVGRLRDMF